MGPAAFASLVEKRRPHWPGCANPPVPLAAKKSARPLGPCDDGSGCDGSDRRCAPCPCCDGIARSRGRCAFVLVRDRKSVVLGTSVSVREDLGGRRIYKKK